MKNTLSRKNQPVMGILRYAVLLSVLIVIGCPDPVNKPQPKPLQGFTYTPGAGKKVTDVIVTGKVGEAIKMAAVPVLTPAGASAVYALDASSPALPGGLGIDAETGKITGIPTANTVGRISIVVKASGTGAYSGTKTAVVKLKVDPIKLPDAMSYPVTTVEKNSTSSAFVSGAQGVTAEYAFDTTGTNPLSPVWLTINSSTRTISIGEEITPVPVSAAAETTYKIKVTGTGQYSRVPEKILDFTLKVTPASLPADMSYGAAEFVKGSSGTAAVSNAPSAGVEYAFDTTGTNPSPPA